MYSPIIVCWDSLRTVQNLETELFLIDVLGINSSWPQFPEPNADLSKLIWLAYRSKNKILLLSKVQQPGK